MKQPWCEPTLDDLSQGKGASGSNREAESTDAPERGGLLRNACEAKGRVTDVGFGQPATGGTEYSTEGPLQSPSAALICSVVIQASASASVQKRFMTTGSWPGLVISTP